MQCAWPPPWLVHPRRPPHLTSAETAVAVAADIRTSCGDTKASKTMRGGAGRFRCLYPISTMRQSLARQGNERERVCATEAWSSASSRSLVHVGNQDVHDVADEDDSAIASAFLTLGHVLAAIGAEYDPPIGLNDIRVIRHAFNTGEALGLRVPEDLTEDKVRECTRFQGLSPRQFPAEPERHWVVLVADGQRRSRLCGACENHDEITAERTAEIRFFDLHRSDFLKPLVSRLVVQWDTPRVWHRRAASAARMPVLEIADRDQVPLPGFDKVLLTFQELSEMVSDRRYADWQVVLSQVQGIYLITDSSNGKQYVGKADGAERILQRWRAYAQDGHGGNHALKELAKLSIGAGGGKTNHPRHFNFSILRVFGPGTSLSEVDDAESHYKRAGADGSRVWPQPKLRIAYTDIPRLTPHLSAIWV